MNLKEKRDAAVLSYCHRNLLNHTVDGVVPETVFADGYDAGIKDALEHEAVKGLVDALTDAPHWDAEEFAYARNEALAKFGELMKGVVEA